MEAAWKMRIFPIVSASLLVFLVMGSVLWIRYARPSYIAHLIHRDVAKLAKMLKQIDRDCAVVSIKQQRTPIDFLTIKGFEGSEIGSIALAHPARWQGPYLHDNPSLQDDILYEIVKLKEGYFVIPGVGVVLPNKLAVGQDFEIHAGISFKTLTMHGGPLNYRGIIMGAPLDFHIGDWQTEPTTSKLPEDMTDKLDRMVSEFNDAMTFTKFEHDDDSLFDLWFCPITALV